jgi:hypothetical protein
MITLYRGGSLQRYVAADFLLAREGIFTLKRLFGFCLPSLQLPCELRGLPSLFTPSVALETSLCPPGPSYHLLTPQTPLSTIFDPARLYQYLIAGNGVFVLARSRDVETCLPLATGSLPGLVSCAPWLRFLHPQVPPPLVEDLFARARAACLDGPQERLFYLLRDGDWRVDAGWRLFEPPQEATEWSVQANHATPESFTAVLEGHSHHRAAAFFSPGDDASELGNGGLRLFFVLGRIFEQPEIRVRLCVHGYAWRLPASLVFELPAGVHDALPDASWEGER